MPTIVHHMFVSAHGLVKPTQAMKKLTFTDSLVATQMHSKEGEIIDFVGESSVMFFSGLGIRRPIYGTLGKHMGINR